MARETPSIVGVVRAPAQADAVAGVLRLDRRGIGWGLLTPLLLAAVLCLHGLSWSWSETWHPDQMAFHQLLNPNRWPLEPGRFLHPPFHTYFNFFLSVVPVKAVEFALEAATGKAWSLSFLSVWWSKILQVTLFLGTVYLVWLCTYRMAGDRAATIVALLLATSAGFIVQAHFLTTDVPVVFWMVLSFCIAQKIPIDQRTRDYVLAGALAGVATATKYNGLVVGLAIPIFHVFATLRQGTKRMVFSPRLILGLGMIPVGFTLANPYALLEFGRFARDFIYVYVITPVYFGNASGDTSYGEVLSRIAEIIGWPVTALVMVFIVWAGIRVRGSAHEPARAGVVTALCVAALYIAKFRAFTRLETRFFLPTVPFLLIATGICWQGGRRSLERIQNGVLVMLLAYNLLSSYWVGRRFAEDPRMQALRWVGHNVRPRSSFESSAYSPDWNSSPGIEVDNHRMPYVAGRRRLFAAIFKDRPDILETVRSTEHDGDLGWYTREALAGRRPEYLAINSMYYDRFLVGPVAHLYPEMNEYVTLLLRGALGYQIVFDSMAMRSPRGLYPENIDFVDHRHLIFRRSDVAPPLSPSLPLNSPR